MKITSLAIIVGNRKFIEIIAALLLVLFVHTLVTTYIQLQSLKNMLAFYTLNTTTVAWSIILSELIVSVLLLIPQTRLIGLVGALVMATFVAYAIVRYAHYPHDFGGIFNYISGSRKWYLIFIVMFLACTGIVASLIHRRRSRPVEKNKQAIYA